MKLSHPCAMYRFFIDFYLITLATILVPSSGEAPGGGDQVPVEGGGGCVGVRHLVPMATS